MNIHEAMASWTKGDITNISVLKYILMDLMRSGVANQQGAIASMTEVLNFMSANEDKIMKNMETILRQEFKDGMGENVEPFIPRSK